MISINVQNEMKKVGLFVKDVSDKVVKQAFFHSANRAIRSGQKISIDRIRQDIKVKQKPVRDRIVIIPASSAKAALASMRAIIGYLGKAIPLAEYSPRQNKSGVSINVKGTRKLVRHAFIATMQSGHKGVFQRKNAKRPGEKMRRIGYVGSNGIRNTKALAIVELFSTTVSDSMKNYPVNSEVRTRILDSFKKNFEHDVKYYLQRAIARAKGK